MRLLLFLSLALVIYQTDAFVVSPKRTATLLCAKKKKQKRSGQGFGEASSAAPSPAKPTPVSADVAARQSQTTQSGLQSVQGGSVAPVTVEQEDPNASPEERASAILRDQYGMRTLEEQQIERKRNEQRKEDQRKLKEWKKMADAGEDFDLIAMIPGPVQVAIDRVLKLGLGVTGIVFILEGIAITVEAWSKTSGDPLPPDIDAIIVNTVEPNFTPTLLVLLGFSVSLGLFAAAQMSSGGAQYRED